LGKEEAKELLTALLGDTTQTALRPVSQLILEKTEGNPFFLEEVVQALAEEGVLRGERGSYRLERTATELHIPPTVQGVLAARIDRLPPDEKEFVQTLSVIGKEFSFGLLRKVTGHSEEGLYRLLSCVQAGEFIYEQPAFPEPEYTFKHALTQEVAYQSVLVERRKALHGRTAQAIEELYPYTLEAHYNELAHHYGHTDDTRKTVEYLHLAGEQALERSALADAVRQLTAGLELLATLPETAERNQRELLLQTALGHGLRVTKGYTAQEVERAYVRARQLCDQVGEAPQLPFVLGGLLGFYLMRAELDKAQELAEQVLSLAQRQQDSWVLTGFHVMLGNVLYFRGELVEAREHLERGIADYDLQYHRANMLSVGPEGGVLQLSLAAVVLWLLGFRDEASKRSREAVTLARELAHPVSLANTFCWVAFLHQLRGEMRESQEQAEATIALSEEHGIENWLAMGTLMRGWAVAMQGQPVEGIREMLSVLDAMRAVGAQIAVPWFLGLLAEVYEKVGEWQEGLAAIGEAMQVTNKTGQDLWGSYLHRLKGDLLLALSEDNQAEAESSLRQAIEIARRQSAKSWELQATTSLARLWQTQDKKEEARQLLAEIYGWFTEGFDTRDLKEAKTLLDELS
jgi:predicted ATPase